MSTARTLTMTVHKIEGALLDVTRLDAKPGQNEYMMGYVTVTAYCGRESHTWTMPEGERCWIGDTVQVTIIEPDRPQAVASMTLPPQERHDW